MAGLRQQPFNDNVRQTLAQLKVLVAVSQDGLIPHPALSRGDIIRVLNHALTIAYTLDEAMWDEERSRLMDEQIAKAILNHEVGS